MGAGDVDLEIRFVLFISGVNEAMDMGETSRWERTMK